MEAKVDSVGRVLLPKALRGAVGIQPGTKVDVSFYGAGLQITPGGRTARLVEKNGRLVATGTIPITDDLMFALIDAGASVTEFAVDSSVAVPLLIETHEFNEVVTGWAEGRELALSGHALAETFSVITRLPDGIRVTPIDAALLIDRSFSAPLRLNEDTSIQLASVLALLGVAGRAVYDALVALAARDAGLPLATRDGRARSTYVRVGIDIEIVS